MTAHGTMWLLILSEQYIKEKLQLHMKLSTHQRLHLPISQASVSFFVSLNALTAYIYTDYYGQRCLQEKANHNFIVECAGFLQQASA